MGVSFVVFEVFVVVAWVCAIVWMIFEIWLFSSAKHLGHVVERRKPENPNGPSLWWQVRVKGWIEGEPFDAWVPSGYTKPADAGAVPVRGRQVGGSVWVRGASFPYRAFAAGVLVLCSSALLWLVVTY